MKTHECGLCTLEFAEESLIGRATRMTVERIRNDFVNSFKVATCTKEENLPPSWLGYLGEFDPTRKFGSVAKLYNEVKLCAMCAQFVPYNHRRMRVGDVYKSAAMRCETVFCCF